MFSDINFMYVRTYVHLVTLANIPNRVVLEQEVMVKERVDANIAMDFN